MEPVLHERNNGMGHRLYETLAIAGAWGYIGQKFLEAARSLQLEIRVHDPGPIPEAIDLNGVVQIASEADFYAQKADLFHLALHPEQRRKGLDALLDRGRHEPISILCEKPMATPERPEQCQTIVENCNATGAIVLYDFPELFDPITARICSYLGQFRQATIDSIEVLRSKDREDPANPRNFKRMVPVQYQESVHCMAFVLALLTRLKGSVEAVFAEGLSVQACSDPYNPPNPKDYSYAVDGRCEYRLMLGPTVVHGRTDFKRGAPWSKQRTIRGVADGRPWVIELDFLEGQKRLSINGESQDDVVDTNSYAEVLKVFGFWQQKVNQQELMTGIYPNAAFARVTYQLSSLLWRSSWEQKALSLASLDALLDFDARFTVAKGEMRRYS